MLTPTRSVVLELKDERRAMQEGYVFLDEKCLLLAGEMLRGLERYSALQSAFREAWEAAVAALQRPSPAMAWTACRSIRPRISGRPSCAAFRAR